MKPSAVVGSRAASCMEGCVMRQVTTFQFESAFCKTCRRGTVQRCQEHCVSGIPVSHRYEQH